jgi:hypothetical protein
VGKGFGWYTIRSSKCKISAMRTIEISRQLLRTRFNKPAHDAFNLFDIEWFSDKSIPAIVADSLYGPVMCGKKYYGNMQGARIAFDLVTYFGAVADAKHIIDEHHVWPEKVDLGKNVVHVGQAADNIALILKYGAYHIENILIVINNQ